MKTLIIDSKKASYLDKVLELNNMADLPDNVMLNKVLTGVGMTSVALQVAQSYVITVPSKTLIINKLAWAQQNNVNLLGIYAYDECGIDIDDIKAFTGNKIMVTYDSLYKVVEALKANGRIKEFKIMIDEAHEVIKSGKFRYKAINSMLKQRLHFDKFIFGTATPVEDRYQHPALKNIPKVQIKWYDLVPVTVNYCVYYKDLLTAVAVQAIEHLDGKMKSNAHFFINSVSDIVVILRHLQKANKFDMSTIRVISADTDENEYKLLKGVGKGCGVSTLESPVKTINFYTSTCFQGCDIYDEDGLCYIISDGEKDHAKIDIIVTLPQIIGRLRNTKYSNHVNLMYSPNRYFSYATEEEFEEFTKNKLAQAAKLVEEYAVASEMARELMLKAASGNIYLLVEGDVITVNESALYSEMQNFATVHKTYYHTSKQRESKEKVDSGSIVINEKTYTFTPDIEIEVKGLNKARLGKKANFESLCKQYKIAADSEKQIIANLYPLIKKAYDILGEAGVGSASYKQKAIEHALITQEKHKTNAWKVTNLLDYKVGQFVTAAKAKEKLQSIYDSLNIELTATGADLAYYFIIKESSKRIEAEPVKGYIILAEKYTKINSN